MMAGVGENAVESVQELQPIREAVAQCIEQLDEHDRFIVDAVNSEMISYEELGQRLGVSKPHAWRLKNAAYDKLKYFLMMHPVIRRRVQVADSWDESAGQWIAHLNLITKDSKRIDSGVLRSLRDKAVNSVRNEELSPLFWTSVGSLAIADLRSRDLWSPDAMLALLVRKQNDYGHGNILKFGQFGVFVRLSDKIERLHNLKTREALAEPYADALWDVVGYCVVALMLDDGTFNLELGDGVVEELSNNSGV
jgi:hypothetical protein